MSNQHNTTLGGNGWAGVDKVLKEYGVQNRALNVPKSGDTESPEVIVQFLEDEPYAKFKAHSVKEGYVSCFDDDCPLCRISHTSRKGSAFNVLLITHEGQEVRTLVITGQEYGTIKNYLAKYPRERWLFNLKRTGVGITPFPVRPEDMEQDWGIAVPAVVLPDDLDGRDWWRGYEVDSTALFTDSPIVTVTRREMSEQANWIIDRRELLKKNVPESPEKALQRIQNEKMQGTTMAERLKAMTS